METNVSLHPKENSELWGKLYPTLFSNTYRFTVENVMEKILNAHTITSKIETIVA